MDKRSWPWKKKSSDKQEAEKTDKEKVDNNGKPKYVQVSIESYTHLTELEDQVKSREEHAKTLEDEVKELKKKLSEARSEIIDKENIVKQHAKVAEEAISGWEKAEAEAESWKNDLESVTVLKVTAEDRASHLDGALKECMRQIRNLKEEHDQKLHQVDLNNTKLFDKMKLELEAKISNLDQELLRSAAENNVLSRSLNERSNMLIELSEEKSQAEAEIQILKNTIDSCEKEVNSLKYELHIAWKEAEIRNEEKNMSVRSAEVANKQHLDGVKKIAKLEAECQRLRGLVRKKLPGPAALAQMKLEVERDYGESRLRRSGFSLDSAHEKYQKENELLIQHLLETEEEMNMLKEALGRRDSIYAETVSKLQCLEAQLQSYEDRKTLRGENDDNLSCAGSCGTGLMSELSRFKKNSDSPHKSENSHLDLMGDFLEMEKLAYQSNGPNGTGCELVKDEPSLEVIASTELEASSNEDAIVANPKKQADKLIFEKLQSKISMALESVNKEKDMEELVAHIQHIMLEMHEILQHFEAAHSSGSVLQTHAETDSITAKTDLTVAAGKTTNEELENAISQICGFVMILGKEMKSVSTKSPDGDGLDRKQNLLSVKYNETINREINLVEFVLDVSHILREASGLQFNVPGFKNAEVEIGNSDCIDKIALPENKIVTDSSKALYSNGCAHFSDSASNSDVPNDGILVPVSESSTVSLNCSSDIFEQLKMDKDKLIVDLARCVENFDSTKAQLLETEQLLAEVKLELTSAHKSNSLAETQLKCMAESYETLEARAEKLEAEVNVLQGRIESLDNELKDERKNHQDAVFRCKDLQEQLQRIESHAEANNVDNTSQEELTAATKKLAECQETIFLLGKQLKAMRPQSNIPSSPNWTQNIESCVEKEPNVINDTHLQDIDPSEKNTATSLNLHEADADAKPLMGLFDSPFNQSDSESSDQLKSPVSSKYTKQWSTNKSWSSSSGSSTPTPEKQVRGFSRFFSSKGKNDH